MRVTVASIMVILVLSVFSGCSQLPDIALWGRVDLDAPVGSGTVYIANGSTGDVVWEGPVSDGVYLTRLNMGAAAACGQPIKLTISGGTVNGVPFNGTLKTYIPAYLPGDHLETNIITTLIARCMEELGFSYEDAEQAVFDFLQMPRDHTFIDRAHQEKSHAQFDPEEFLLQAGQFGGFDAFVDYLVKNEIGLGSSRNYSALYENEEMAPAKQTPPPAAMEASVGGSMMDGVYSGIGSFAAQQALGWILASFGYKDQTARNFDQVKAALKQMNTEIGEIIKQGDTIEGQLNTILIQMELDKNEIIQEINSTQIKGPQDIIENQFQNLRDSFSPDNVQAHTDAGYGSAQQASSDLLGAGKYDIDQQLYSLHSGIMGLTVGSTGFLDSCTNVLIDKATAGGDVYNCYLVLENYYCKLLAIQAKGLVLMADALHFANGDLTQNSKSFTGSVADYYVKHSNNMETQLNKFMSCVDRLVISQVNARTDLASPVQLLADNTGSVYARCDFLAHQLSKNHPSGLVLRIIGPPSALANVLNNNVEAMDTTIVTTGGRHGGTTWTNTSYPFTIVNVNSAGTNLYKPNLPSHSPDNVIRPDNSYLEWVYDPSSGWKYQLQDKVAVVKMVMGAGKTSEENYMPCTNCTPSTSKSWSIYPFVDNESAGSVLDNLKTYDGSFSPATTGTSFRSFTFATREQPGDWTTSAVWKKTQGKNTIVPSFDSSSMRFAELLTINEYTTHRSCSYVAGDEVCQDYWIFDYEVSGSFNMDIVPMSPANIATLGVIANLKIGLANGAKGMDNTKVTWNTSLGSSISQAASSAGTYSSSPADASPTTSVNMNTSNDISGSAYVPSVQFKFVSTSPATLKLQHDITGYNEWIKKTTSLFCDSHAAYTKLELYPVP